MNILSQPHDPARAARRFQERFKQFAIAREVESAVFHLSSRISNNGWTFGPSFDFLEWLAQMPVSQVGAIPRFAVLRWALGEDPDLWLPLRGRVSRNSPCAWCAQSARTYPFGPHKGVLCVNCIGTDPGEFVDLPPEALAFLRQHAPASPARAAPLLPIKNCARDTKGPLGDVALTPCVLCQSGSNAIDHWLSYCPVVHIAWAALYKWSGQCTHAIKKTKHVPVRKPGQSKKYRNSGTSKILSYSRRKSTSKKHDPPQQTQAPANSAQRAQDSTVLETYGPPPDDATTVPAEMIRIIEDEISQFSEIPKAVLTTPHEGGDPSHCPSLVVRTSQTHAPNASRPGPHTAESQGSGAVDQQSKAMPKGTASAVTQKSPYAILSMFDGCGSSVDIIEAKFGYRPKACILCEKDETLRYLVGEKHGITVDQKWQHSLKGGGAFYYAKDVDNLFVDNARLLREFVALGSDCHFFVIGGSPCTDLTYAGGDHGHLGVCGPASVLFFTMHLAIYLIATFIPGDRIRFFVENAGSMRHEHFCFIRACLGLRHVQKADLTWCTSVISPARRMRIFFQNNTSYECPEMQAIPTADLDWPKDWSPLIRYERGMPREVSLQPFMRPIAVLSDLALRYSWSSYHPSALLWRISHWHTKDCFATLANLTSDNGIPNFQWNSFIPPIYRAAWMYLLKCFATGAPNTEKDVALRDVLPLFHNASIQLPFRLLTDQEVLQISGLSQNFGSIVHLKHLLTPHTIRSYVGNSFHPKLVSLALGTAEDLQAWVQGKLPSVTKVADPTTVRKNYLRFKQEISNTFARNNYTPKSELVTEPYRHHDYRAIVMSPIEAPKVAQPTVGNILPAYLTKEVMQADLQKDAEARLRVLGMPQFLRFLEDCQLAQYAQEIAVPQWVPFTSNIADSLVQGCSLLLLPAYARGLFAQPTLPRAILFFNSLVASSTTEKNGFFVISYRHSPCQIHYIALISPKISTWYNFGTLLTSYYLSMVGNPFRLALPQYTEKNTQPGTATVLPLLLMQRRAS